MAHIVVVGAGVGGLAAAARLHALGHSVTVCERSKAVGGKLATHTVGGYRFDTGPSLLTLPDVFRELFAATGDPLDQTLPLERVDPHCRYVFDDGVTLEIPASRSSLPGAIERTLGAAAAGDWQRLLRRAERMWEVARGPFLESPGPPALLPLAWRNPLQLPVIAPGRSLHWLARRSLRDPRLRALLERYATYAGSDPRKAPAALATTAHVEQEYGCWYIPGGLHRLAQALADRLPPGGVRTETAVTTVQTAAGRVCGVLLDNGRALAADAVVANVDAEHLYRDLVGQPKLAPDGTRSSAGFVILLGLRGQQPQLAHHTVLFPPLDGAGYTAEFDAVFDGRPATDPTVYVSAPVDPLVAPSSGRAAFVLVNAPCHGVFDWDSSDVSESYARRILAVMAHRGLDIRGDVELCEIRTPADLERDTGAPGGAIYGTASHGPRAAFRRAANRSPVPGLFLVGGSAHPGGGLPLVALSARAVAGLIGTA